MTAALLTLTVAGVLALAGYVQGLTGFGFGLVAMGLLTPVLGLDQALAVVTLASLITSVATTGLTLRHVHWPGARRLWMGSVVGVPVGYLLMSALPRDVVVRALGLTICLLVAFEVTVSRRVDVATPGWAGWCFGLASGALSGAFNVGGPPLVAYVYGRPWPKEQQVATLSLVFLTSGIIRLTLLLASERLPGSSWAVTAWSAVPMLAAIVCGNFTLNLITTEQLRAGVRVALLALGGRFLIVGS